MTDLPAGEVPRYRLTRDLKPSHPRHRSETPFSNISDDSVWQYCEHELAAGSEISTDRWPHASMIGLNTAAREILEFFRTRQRSRMQLKPIRAGLVHLDDGLTFSAEVNFRLKTGAAA